MEIDQILVKDAAGGQRVLDLAGWQTLPVTERIEYITEDRVEFASGGKILPVQDALAAIKGRGKRHG